MELKYYWDGRILFLFIYHNLRGLVTSPSNLTPDFIVKDLVIYPPASLCPEPSYILFRQSVSDESR